MVIFRGHLPCCALRCLYQQQLRRGSFQKASFPKATGSRKRNVPGDLNNSTLSFPARVSPTFRHCAHYSCLLPFLPPSRFRRVIDPSVLLPPRAFCCSAPAAMDTVDTMVRPMKEFAKDSVRLVKRCQKPDRKEFSKVAFRTAIGFVVMGFIGFFVKLIFIPINNIIVGAS